MAQRSFRAVAGRSPPLNRPTDRIAHLWRHSGTAVDRFCWPNLEEANPLARSVPVTHRSLTGRQLTGSGVPITTYCTAQFNVSFLRSRPSCQKRRAAQSAKSLPITKHLGAAARCALRKLGGTVAGASARPVLGQGRTAVTNTKPTLQAVTSSAENNPEISVQRIEVDIVREELLDENDVT